MAFEAWLDESEKHTGVEEVLSTPVTERGSEPNEEDKLSLGEQEPSERDSAASEITVEQNQTPHEGLYLKVCASMWFNRTLFCSLSGVHLIVLFLVIADSKEESHQTSSLPENQLIICVTALCIMCSCSKDQACQGRRFQAFQHKSVLITGVSLSKKQPREQNGENLLGPQLLVYDVSQDSEKKSKESNLGREKTKMMPSAVGSKSLGVEYPYTYSPTGSEEDWFEPSPVILPEDLHSSVLQKFAQAIVGDEKGQELHDKSGVSELNKGSILQCLRLPENLGGDCQWNVSQIVPCSDGHQVLVLLKPEKTGSSQTNPDTGSSENCSVEMPQCSSTSKESHEKNTEIGGQENAFSETFGCAIVVYRLIKKDAKITIFPDPVCIRTFDVAGRFPTNVLGLPLENVEICDDDELSCVSQCAALLSDGSLALMDTNNLQILTRFSAKEGDVSEHFVHVMRCPGADCISVCTSSGKLCFVSIRHHSANEQQVNQKEDMRNEDLTDAGPYPGKSCYNLYRIADSQILCMTCWLVDTVAKGLRNNKEQKGAAALVAQNCST